MYRTLRIFFQQASCIAQVVDIAQVVGIVQVVDIAFVVPSAAEHTQPAAFLRRSVQLMRDTLI